MLTAARALSLNHESGAELPRVAALEDLYSAGTILRRGQVIMVAGRSGSQKSGFALWLVDELGLDTLYFSADMSAFTASTRVACKRLGLETEQVEEMLADETTAPMVYEAIEESRIVFAFGSPIRWAALDEELEAWVELHDSYPDVIVIDNLMDVENATTDYTVQMDVMQLATELARVTGSTIIIMHHASDKTFEAKTDPWKPPGRNEIKNGLGEKPELTLTVSLDPVDLSFRVATVKQRMGPSDMSGNRYITLTAHPGKTTFTKYIRASLRG